MVNELTPSSEIDTKHADNCFDFLRLFAALLVLVSHSFPLVGAPEPAVLKVTLGEIGVNIFFTTSGYLITQSWLRCPAPRIYLAKRSLRIFPALVVVLVVSVFVVGPCVTSHTWGEYFSSKQTYRYLMNVVFVGGGSLPGVFESNPFANSVNGSLWTLKYEFAMYILIMILGVLAKKKSNYLKLYLLGALFVFATIALALNGIFPGVPVGRSLKEGMVELGISELSLRFPLLATFFLLGAVFSNKRFGRMADWIAMFGVGVGSILLSSSSVGLVFLWGFIAYASLNIGVSSFRILRAFGRYGDFSYGVYIYAFLVQQVVSRFLMPNIDWLVALTLSALITCVCAWSSWTWIESPSLRLKNSLT